MKAEKTSAVYAGILDGEEAQTTEWNDEWVISAENDSTTHEPEPEQAPCSDRARLNAAALRPFRHVLDFLDGPFFPGSKGNTFAVVDGCNRVVCRIEPQIEDCDDLKMARTAEAVAEAMTLAFRLQERATRRA